MRQARRALLSSFVAVLAVAPAAEAARARDEVRPTGRFLVSFEDDRTAQSASALTAVLERVGARRAGAGVPQLGIATVDGSAAAIAALRRHPLVESVSVEYQRALRAVPNDPVLQQQEEDSPSGTSKAWWLGRMGYFGAWDVTTGGGALVGVVDSGTSAGHPELGGKIASAAAFGDGSPGSDEDGHGSHVSGLACASTNDGRPVVGAGWDCRLVVSKTPRLFDQDIVAGIRSAADRGAQSINMSFGGGPCNAALSQAIDYAVSRGVVLVAAASNFTDTDQGAPASCLQPGDAPDINAGRGLVVTASDFSDRNADTGRGAQISVAAYGFFDGIVGDGRTGPIGLISSYPGGPTQRESAHLEGPFLVPGCGCRTSVNGDNRYARLEGTSMSAPLVSALGALVGNINPALSVQEKLRIIKDTARNGGWEPMLGWGIIDANGALQAARRIDRFAPDSRVLPRGGARLPRGRRAVALRLNFRGADRATRAGQIPSGVASYDLYMRLGNGRFRRIRTALRSPTTIIRPGPGIYRFYTRVRDRAGNVEPTPANSDLRLVVRR